MKKLAFAAMALTFSMFMLVAPVSAESDGQLAGGADIYQVRNVTKNTQYGSTVSATCNDVVKYSVKLSNTEFGLLSNVTVKASLADGSMTASATNASNATVTTSGNVTVSLDKGSLNYVAGSTQLFTVDGQLIKGLPDGVTAGGVNAGNLNGSTREFVQFQAKVTCETNEVPKDIKVCELSTKKVITIKENQFDSAKHTKDLTKCNEVPTTLVNTGAGDVLGIFAAVTAAGALAYRFVLARRFDV